MKITSAEFIASAATYDQCPAPSVPEFAFIGRSNVGKSSLLNLLTNHSKLAHVSNTPGRTQLLNFFLINKRLAFVDMPGYGYAKVAKERREQFIELVTEYITGREALRCVFVLIDSSIPAQKIDLEFVQWVMGEGIPFVLIFTKTDKASPTKVARHIKEFGDKVLEFSVNLPMMFQCSAHHKTGVDEVLNLVRKVVDKKD